MRSLLVIRKSLIVLIAALAVCPTALPPEGAGCEQLTEPFGS